MHWQRSVSVALQGQHLHRLWLPSRHPALSRMDLRVRCGVITADRYCSAYRQRRLRGRVAGGAGLVADDQRRIDVQTGAQHYARTRACRIMATASFKISATSGLKIVDYFSPSNQGSSVGLRISISGRRSRAASRTSLLLGGGKDGKIFVLSTNNLGNFTPPTRLCNRGRQHSACLHRVQVDYTAEIFITTPGYILGRQVFPEGLFIQWVAIQSDTVSRSTSRLLTGKSNEPAMSLSANADNSWNRHSCGLHIPSTDSHRMAWHIPESCAPLMRRMCRKNYGTVNKKSRAVCRRQLGEMVPPTVANGKVYLATWDNRDSTCTASSPPAAAARCQVRATATRRRQTSPPKAVPTGCTGAIPV